MTRTLVVIGTPLPDTFTHALAAAYVEGLTATDAGAEVRVHDLARDPVPPHPASRSQLRAPDGDTAHLEPEVRRYLTDLVWAEHVVVLHPQWWGTYPAALSAWIDRVMLSGVAFRYGRGHVSERLLTGRTARLVMTMDSPRVWNALVYRNAAQTSLRRAVLGFVGIRTVGTTRLPAVRFADDARRRRWVAKVRALGVADARRRGVADAQRRRSTATRKSDSGVNGRRSHDASASSSASPARSTSAKN